MSTLPMASITLDCRNTPPKPTAAVGAWRPSVAASFSRKRLARVCRCSATFLALLRAERARAAEPTSWETGSTASHTSPLATVTASPAEEGPQEKCLLSVADIME